LAALAALLLIPRVRHWLGKGWRLLLGDRGAHGQLLSARFLQAVSMAVSSGMTPREAMLLARELAEGEAKAFHNRCKCAMEEVEKDVPLHLALEKHVKAAEAAAQAYVKTYSMTGSNANIRFHTLNAALRSQSFLIALKRDEAIAFDVLHRCGYIV
jgi:hypothetical protein